MEFRVFEKIVYHVFFDGICTFNVISDVISGDKKVKNIINIDAFGKSLIFPSSL
ncbi:hypothetical protein LptCag_0804 [Leptospirillum ferriphilum]|uniref:Uncharacterized protein n=1 Tax=Leptospirillum ferriphilum TaxID=178606 RepID=A0A094W9H8_9BACT|nr:hypothetical protein LptCag_0804 [Leptospirillum ferriphilum]